MNLIAAMLALAAMEMAATLDFTVGTMALMAAGLAAPQPASKPLTTYNHSNDCSCDLFLIEVGFYLSMREHDLPHAQ
ncbi:hypothetical protein [Bradyrhizobium prioriisuperbiae]|uniref:hypothetical protein n=1 Tax=Bradyrhizobium prioriisuperbiae TaxID=2854389 RepID=UPI0028E60F17|nr:hypothetical protein [Bradyrhizobium prioritasuperba]